MYRIVIGLILFFNSSLYSSSQLDSLVQKGLEQSYNFEFEKSEATFNRIISEFPDHPEGYFYLSQNHLWFYLGSRDEGEIRTFELYTELAFERCENLLSENDTSAYYTELMGNLALQDAMVEASEENTLAAFFSTKSAYSYFEDALEIDSLYYRAYLGLGLLEYALSYVPGVFKWAIDISGLGRDKEKGFKFVCRANEHAADQISRTESAFHKAKMLAEYMGNTGYAITILDSLTNLYPRNLLFKYQLALAQIDNRELVKALSNLTFIVDNQDKRFIQTIAFSYFLLGEVQFKMNNYQAAIEYYEKFLVMSRGFEYSGMAYLNMALSCLLMDDEISAKKYLVLARNGNSDISDDLYAARRSEYLYENLPDSSSKILLIAKNHLQAGQYEKVLSTLNPIIDSLKFDNYIEGSLILAEAFYYTSHINSSLSTLSKITPLNVINENWLIPYYYYLNAMIHLSLNQIEEASSDLESAYDSNEHDFQEKILAKLNYLKSKIDN